MVRSQARTMEQRPEHYRSVGRVLFHHITTSWLIFGDPTNGRCRHTLTAALISIQVHAYARSSKGSAAWSCDVPYRRNSVRSGQPRASKCNSSVQPPLVWARPRQTFHEHISRKAPRTGGLRFLGARPALVCIAFAGTTFMDFPRVT
jgi:hypothetical protein